MRECAVSVGWPTVRKGERGGVTMCHWSALDAKNSGRSLWLVGIGFVVWSRPKVSILTRKWRRKTWKKCHRYPKRLCALPLLHSNFFTNFFSNLVWDTRPQYTSFLRYGIPDANCGPTATSPMAIAIFQAAHKVLRSTRIHVRITVHVPSTNYQNKTVQSYNFLI